MQTNQMQINQVPKWKSWLIATRLRTLSLSLSGLVLGGAFAHKAGYFSTSIFIFSIITALLLQILSNFANDYGDAMKGTDTKSTNMQSTERINQGSSANTQGTDTQGTDTQAPGAQIQNVQIPENKNHQDKNMPPAESKNYQDFSAYIQDANLQDTNTQDANEQDTYIKFGQDQQGRLGPTRMVSSGAISPTEMFQAILFLIGLCVVSGFSLLVVSFGMDFSKWLIFIGLGIASIAAALFYTMGPKPYGYSGLGDFFVFIFFGLVSVLGSYYLYGAPLADTPIFPACGVGLFAVAVLNTNNIRDMKNDALHGKNTLALYLGAESARQYQLVLVFGGILCWASYLAVTYDVSSLYLLIFALPVIFSTYKVYTSYEHDILDKQLKICALGSGFFHLACAIYIFQV